MLASQDISESSYRSSCYGDWNERFALARKICFQTLQLFSVPWLSEVSRASQDVRSTLEEIDAYTPSSPSNDSLYSTTLGRYTDRVLDLVLRPRLKISAWPVQWHDHGTGRIRDLDHLIFTPHQSAAPALRPRTRLIVTPHQSAAPALRPRTHVGGILDGLSVDAIPDNCSTHNLISQADVEKLTAKDNVTPAINYFGLPDQTVMKSTGTISLPFAYADQPNRFYDLLFYVVDSCPGGIILGKEFLQMTRLFAQENLHRLKRCLSSAPRISFRLVDDTSQRLHGWHAEASGLDEHTAVVLDFGADRNVMSLKFATERKHHIKRDPEHRGILVFADGTERETVGQVETWWTFASGERVPVTYEVLPDCFADVVLGDEFIWEHQVYRDHADSIQNLDTELDIPEVHYMGWKHNWFGGLAKIASSVGVGANNLAPLPPNSGQTLPISLSYDEELQRQEEWNDKFDDGHSSPLVEWYLEHQRRERFEERLLPGWHFDPAGRPLIQRYSSEHPNISSTGTI